MTDIFIETVLKTLKSHYKTDDPQKITGFEIQKLYFFVYHEHNLDFFGTTPNKEDRFQAMEELKEVASKFCHRYPRELLDAWNGDKQFFFDFYQQINPPQILAKPSLVEPINKISKPAKGETINHGGDLIHTEGNNL